MNKLDISVVVPLYNEAESLPELVAWIDRVAAEHGYTYEVILVDDGSSDDSWSVVESLKKQYPAVRGIGFARNYGKSAALYCGFAAAEGEKPVEHRARKYGRSKFGLERMLKGYLDLISVLFMSHFGRSPMYFFGSLGTLMFLIGGGTTVWIIAAKIWKQVHELPLRAVTDQPLFYLAILAIILGVQLFLAGFLGELINRGSSDRNKYLIDKTL